MIKKQIPLSMFLITITSWGCEHEAFELIPYEEEISQIPIFDSHLYEPPKKQEEKETPLIATSGTEKNAPKNTKECAIFLPEIGIIEAMTFDRVNKNDYKISYGYRNRSSKLGQVFDNIASITRSKLKPLSALTAVQILKLPQDDLFNEFKIEDQQKILNVCVKLLRIENPEFHDKISIVDKNWKQKLPSRYTKRTKMNRSATILQSILKKRLDKSTIHPQRETKKRKIDNGDK